MDEITFVIPDGTWTSFGGLVEWLVMQRPKVVTVALRPEESS